MATTSPEGSGSGFGSQDKTEYCCLAFLILFFIPTWARSLLSVCIEVCVLSWHKKLTPLEFEKGVHRQQHQQQMKLKSKCNHKCKHQTTERCRSICICICGTWAEQMKCLDPNCKDLAIAAAANNTWEFLLICSRSLWGELWRESRYWSLENYWRDFRRCKLCSFTIHVELLLWTPLNGCNLVIFIKLNTFY